MKGFLFGLVIGVIAVPVIFFCYFYLGLAPVATDSPSMPFERYLARVALRARIDREMPKGDPPMQATDENLIGCIQKITLWFVHFANQKMRMGRSVERTGLAREVS